MVMIKDKDDDARAAALFDEDGDPTAVLAGYAAYPHKTKTAMAHGQTGEK